MPDNIADKVDYEIRVIGGNDKKDLGQNTKQTQKVRQTKLLLRHKSGWIKDLKAFDKAELVALKSHAHANGCPHEDDPSSTNASGINQHPQMKRQAAGGNHPLPPKSLKKAKACVHDWVEPLVVSRVVKRPCTDPYPDRQVALRVVMLSAKLRKRFGHLCTKC